MDATNPSAATARLRIEQQDEPEREVELGDHLTIGRSLSNDLVIRDSNASRSHAEIRPDPSGRYRLFDLGSINGTWLNGKRVAVPADLGHGDVIEIGAVSLHFMDYREDRPISEPTGPTTALETSVAMKKISVIVLVSDIRNYTGMSERLETNAFSALISDWFRDAGERIQAHGGTIDKFIGDAVMAYWIVRNPENPREQVAQALTTAKETIALAAQYCERIGRDFPGNRFAVGIGINSGIAIIGNVGASVKQDFTVVGDTVNVAFRLERLSKEKGEAVILSGDVVEYASKWFKFKDLGEVQVKGREEAVPVWAMKV